MALTGNMQNNIDKVLKGGVMIVDVVSFRWGWDTCRGLAAYYWVDWDDGLDRTGGDAGMSLEGNFYFIPF